MREFHIKSPVSLGGVSAKGRFQINRNRIHQSHFSSIAKAKRVYKDLMKKQIVALPKLGKVKIRYTLHRGDKRKSDRNNVLGEVDKFFMDALTHYGILLDDDDEFYEYTVFKSGEICKNDAHAMITIIELKTRAELEEEGLL